MSPPGHDDLLEVIAPFDFDDVGTAVLHEPTELTVVCSTTQRLRPAQPNVKQNALSATITAAPVGVEGGTDVLIPPDAQLSTDTVGGREVDVYENGAGRSYRWDDDGIVVLVRATADSDQIIANITVSIDSESGLARIETGVLPDGIEVIAAPEPLSGNQPGLSTDDGPANPILNLYPTNSPLTVETSEIGGRSIVEINGATGYATSFGDGAIVTWPSRAGTWLELSAAQTTVDDLIEIARHVQLVDQTSWERRYDVTYTAQTSTPPTTMG